MDKNIFLEYLSIYGEGTLDEGYHSIKHKK